MEKIYISSLFLMQSVTNYVLKQDRAAVCAPALIRRPVLKSNTPHSEIFMNVYFLTHVLVVFLGDHDVTYLIKFAFQFGKLT